MLTGEATKADNKLKSRKQNTDDVSPAKCSFNYTTSSDNLKILCRDITDTTTQRAKTREVHWDMGQSYQTDTPDI